MTDDGARDALFVERSGSGEPAPSGRRPVCEVPDAVVDALGRLPHHSSVRVAARQMLAGQAPPALDVFLQPLRSTNAAFWRERVVAAWGLAQATAGTDRADDAAIALMDALQDSGQGPGEGWFVRGLGRLGVCTLAVTILMGSQWFGPSAEDLIAAMGAAGFLLAGIVLPISSAYDQQRVNRVRASIALASARLGAVECIGPLAEAYVKGSGLVADATRDALLQLLPRVEPAHFGMFGASSMAALCRTLRSDDSQLVVKVLHALECVGTSQAIPELERLTRHGRTMRIRDDAGRVLATVQSRRDDEMQRQRLLRPASGPTDQLLRPVESARASDPDFLLRAVVGEDEHDQQ